MNGAKCDTRPACEGVPHEPLAASLAELPSGKRGDESDVQSRGPGTATSPETRTAMAIRPTHSDICWRSHVGETPQAGRLAVRPDTMCADGEDARPTPEQVAAANVPKVGSCANLPSGARSALNKWLDGEPLSGAEQGTVRNGLGTLGNPRVKAQVLNALGAGGHRTNPGVVADCAGR